MKTIKIIKLRHGRTCRVDKSFIFGCFVHLFIIWLHSDCLTEKSAFSAKCSNLIGSEGCDLSIKRTPVSANENQARVIIVLFSCFFKKIKLEDFESPNFDLLSYLYDLSKISEVIIEFLVLWLVEMNNLSRGSYLSHVIRNCTTKRLELFCKFLSIGSMILADDF